MGLVDPPKHVLFLCDIVDEAASRSFPGFGLLLLEAADQKFPIHETNSVDVPLIFLAGGVGTRPESPSLPYPLVRDESRPVDRVVRREREIQIPAIGAYRVDATRRLADDALRDVSEVSGGVEDDEPTWMVWAALMGDTDESVPPEAQSRGAAQVYPLLESHPSFLAFALAGFELHERQLRLLGHPEIAETHQQPLGSRVQPPSERTSRASRECPHCRPRFR